jgi:hypothetical protein
VFDGTRFEGNWVNDVKHGPGRVTYANGEKICGTWQNDHINGIAVRNVAGKAMTVIFKNDILIMHNESGLSRYDICYAISSAIFFLSFFGFFACGILVGEEAFICFILCLVPYLWYISWSCYHHPTINYI